MKHITDNSKNDILLKHLSVLCECYSTGRFDALFPLLSDEIIFESQWVFEPLVGRADVEYYFTGKGETLRNQNCCPRCEIVELIGNINMISNADVHINGEEAKTSSFGLWYPEGKLCMYMNQTLTDKENGVIADLTLDGSDLISRIDLCMPQLFNFKPYNRHEKRGNL